LTACQDVFWKEAAGATTGKRTSDSISALCQKFSDTTARPTVMVQHADLRYQVLSQHLGNRMGSIARAELDCAFFK